MLKMKMVCFKSWSEDDEKSEFKQGVEKCVEARSLTPKAEDATTEVLLLIVVI